MNPSRPEKPSLTAQEQALAQELGQLPAGSPSQDLDARILAEARAAVSATPGGTGQAAPGQHNRVRRASTWRWPLRLATAATLMLAVGLVWQLGLSPQSSFEEAADFPIRMEPATPAASDQQRHAPASSPMTEALESAPSRQAESSGDAQSWSGQADDERPAQSARRRQESMSTQRLETVPAPSPMPPVSSPARPIIAPAPEPPMESAMQEQAPREPPRPQEPPLPPADPATAADIAPLSAPVPVPTPTSPAVEPPPDPTGIPADLDTAIQEIRRLLTAGQTRAAKAALDALLELHPEAELPPDLAGLRHLSLAEPGH